jgi:RNase H-fold protein (predicted Holliday junction resolvase)
MNRDWYCGLDISKYRIGIALGYRELISPLKIISSKDFVEEINKIKKQYGNITYIIGLPQKKYHNFKFIKNFTHQHRELVKPFIFQDEGYTSILSTDINSKNHDDIAACVILESYFIENKIKK